MLYTFFTRWKRREKAVTDADLLVLLEGDVSNDDHEISDEADIEDDVPDHTSCTISGLDQEMIEVQEKEEMEVNDVPLQT